MHEAYLAAGADCVETNTFGANLANLGEYGIADRIFELSAGRGPAGPGGGRRLLHPGPAPLRARLDRARAPSCRRSGMSPYATLRDAYQQNAAGLVDGGADAMIVETCQDLLQTKAAVIGAQPGDRGGRAATCR